MVATNPIGIIELGNINLKCLIFNINDNNESDILSTSITQSEGIHNGVITNISSASKSIRVCISEAEKKSKVFLKKINIVLEQPEFLCTKFSKSRKINGSKIYKEDIEFLLKEAKKQVLTNDNRHSIIHIFNHNYIVDGKKFVEEPINVYADHLSHEMTFVTMPKNNIKNINQTFNECDIEIERYISGIFASATKLLNEREFQDGAGIIDIGYEKTSLGLFKNLALIHSMTLPIGINHLTKDISKVCSLDLEESENLVKNIDYSFKNNNKLFDSSDLLNNSCFVNSKYRKISKTLIIDIIKARLDEILKMIKDQIIVSGQKSFILNNLFIVGEALNLFNFETYCSVFFENEIKKFDKKNYKNDLNEKFTSCLGALKIIKDGWETEAIPEPISKIGPKISFFSKFFGNKS